MKMTERKRAREEELHFESYHVCTVSALFFCMCIYDEIQA